MRREEVLAQCEQWKKELANGIQSMQEARVPVVHLKESLRWGMEERGERWERFPSSLYKARWGRRVLTLPPFCTGIWWSPWTHFEQSLRRSNRQTLALTQTRSSATLMMSCLSASHDFSCNSFRVIICSLFCKCVCIWVHLFVQLQQACSDYLWIKIS